MTFSTPLDLEQPLIAGQPTARDFEYVTPRGAGWIVNDERGRPRIIPAPPAWGLAMPHA